MERKCSEPDALTAISSASLLLGSRGVAGEIGHMSVIPDGHQCGCGHIGCMETVCSGPAIASAAAHYIVQGMKTQIRDMIGDDLNRLSPLTVCSAANNGDAVALRILDNAVHYLCAAIRNLIVLLNPQAIILGGKVAETSWQERSARRLGQGAGRVEPDLHPNKPL